MKVILEMNDGTVYEAEGSARTYMCLGDRMAFKDQFGVAPAVMALWKSAFEEQTAADGTTTHEVSATATAAMLGEIDEAYTLFFAWRWLGRHCTDVPEFTVVKESVTDCDVQDADPNSPTTTPT